MQSYEKFRNYNAFKRRNHNLRKKSWNLYKCSKIKRCTFAKDFKTLNDSNMKRTFLNRVLLTVISLLAVACSSDEAGEVNAQTTGASGKTLVVYYSYTNNCREIVTSLTSLLQVNSTMCRTPLCSS